MCGTTLGLVVYELTAGPCCKIQIWTSPEGLFHTWTRTGQDPNCITR